MWASVSITVSHKSEKDIARTPSRRGRGALQYDTFSKCATWMTLLTINPGDLRHDEVAVEVAEHDSHTLVG